MNQADADKAIQIAREKLDLSERYSGNERELRELRGAVSITLNLLSNISTARAFDAQRASED